MICNIVARFVIQKLTSEHTSYRLVSRLGSEFQDGKNAFQKKLGNIKEQFQFVTLRVNPFNFFKKSMYKVIYTFRKQ